MSLLMGLLTQLYAGEKENLVKEWFPFLIFVYGLRYAMNAVRSPWLSNVYLSAGRVLLKDLGI
jgi:hypothetical protein